MESSNKISDKEKALRKEFAERTVKANLKPDSQRRQLGDSEYVRDIGKKISQLLDDEQVEEARVMLAEAIKDNPSELGFLNLQTIIDIIDHPVGDYKSAKQWGLKTAEKAVETQNTYYLMAVLCNMGLVALYEGNDIFGKVMYLAAHHIDSKALTPLQNLLSWCSRKGRLDEAMNWVEKILEAFPDWRNDAALVRYFKKDESLSNLRKHEPFKTKVMSNIGEAD